MNTEITTLETEDGIINDGFILRTSSKKILIATHGMGSNCFKEREKIIAKKVLENGIGFLGYNNRGSELVKNVRKNVDGVVKKFFAGTTYEDPKEGYFDIKAAVEKTVSLGYTDIYLQGHSLGATKVLYTYNKLKKENSELLKYIKGVVLLSLIDIPKVLKIYLGENYEKMMNIAIQKENEKKILDLMPRESFIHPISVKTFLEYSKYSKEIDFAQYSKKDYDYKELNNITVPLFMRWGCENEMIEQNVQDLVNMISQKLNNSKKDINYVSGADHGYTKKEDILANEIVEFLKKI